jgi:hypothetical protein
MSNNSPPDSEATLPPRGDEAAARPPEPGLDILLRPGRPPLPLVLGRYRLEEQLGQGGMGAVYRALDTHLGRTVALKVPFLWGGGREAVKVRFLREAQSAALLAHPNICPVHDLGEIDGVPYLTMAFVRGAPLADRLHPDRPAPPREAVALVRKLALALHEAHTRGIIHRDLKPSNVMIDEHGEPVVMDFGLARRADSALLLTQQGEMLGTPSYMPPEQVDGDVQAMGPASDVYSLGALLYEMVVGRPPFRGDVLAILAQICADEPVAPSRRLPGLNPALDYLCLRALKKDPGQRWESMAAFADALARFLAVGENASGGNAYGTDLLPAGPLVLKVVGSPFAYRAAPQQTVVTLGRQKRRPGEPADVGNDLVLRVPGNDVLSARISRRHLEIHCGDGGLSVTDRSKAGTLLNGRPLQRDVPAALAAGDRLVVAGVLTLEVAAGATLLATPVAEARVAAGAGEPTEVFLEASLGDMLTVG